MLITIGAKGKIIGQAALSAGLHKRSVMMLSSLPEAKSILETTIKSGDLILVKGSSDSRLERLIRDIMREPGLARNVLARQESYWHNLPGLCDSDNLA